MIPNRYLKVLEYLDISGNALASLDDLTKLKSLSNLLQVRISPNPVCKVRCTARPHRFGNIC